MTFYTCYDTASVTNALDKIPDTAEIVAGYIDGSFITIPALNRRFGKTSTRIVTVTIRENGIADYLDVEPGNPVTTPGQVRASYETRKGHLSRPGFYSDLAWMQSVVKPGLAGIPRDRYRLWVANPTGTPHNLLGYDATQYAFDGTFDISLCLNTFLDTPPRRKAKPAPVAARKKVHPKVAAATGAAAVGAAAVTAVNALHGHLTPVEVAAIETLLAAIGGYLKTS